MIKRLQHYMDQDGYIGHFDDTGKLEFGDGAQRLGFYWQGIYRTEDLSNFKKLVYKYQWLKLMLNNGEPVRHIDGTQWFGRAGTMSRDQIVPNISALSLLDHKEELKDLFYKLFKRGMFCWNTKKIGQWDDSWKIPDWCGPVVWGQFIRGLCESNLSKVVFYIPLLFCDFVLFINSLVRIFWPIIDSGHTTDDLNHSSVLDLAFDKMPTPLSWLSRELYILFRPAPSPILLAPDEKWHLGPVLALRQYFYGEKNPPLDEIWEKVYLKWIRS